MIFGFPFPKKSWTIPEIIETFENQAKEIRIGIENNDLIIEVVLDDKTIRKFREHKVGIEILFYED